MLRHPFLDTVQGLAPEDMALGRVTGGEQMEDITAAGDSVLDKILISIKQVKAVGINRPLLST